MQTIEEYCNKLKIQELLECIVLIWFFWYDMKEDDRMQYTYEKIDVEFNFEVDIKNTYVGTYQVS